MQQTVCSLATTPPIYILWPSSKPTSSNITYPSAEMWHFMTPPKNSAVIELGVVEDGSGNRKRSVNTSRCSARGQC
jgi:hypothetical protein